MYIPGTAYHMDVGYIRGPSNIHKIIHEGAQPKHNIQQSHDGYTSYLLIIDAASRYIFVFPLKSGAPLINIIDMFLKRYGNANKKRHLITKTPHLESSLVNNVRV